MPAWRVSQDSQQSCRNPEENIVQISHPGELMGVLNSYDHIHRYTELQLLYAEYGKDTTLVRRE